MAVNVDKERCMGCGACVKVCPEDAIKIEQNKAMIGDERIECSACINECQNEAISLPK